MYVRTRLSGRLGMGDGFDWGDFINNALSASKPLISAAASNIAGGGSNAAAVLQQQQLLAQQQLASNSLSAGAIPLWGWAAMLAGGGALILAATR